MSNFADSVILTFTDFGYGLKKSFENPKEQFGTYSIPSISLILIFLISSSTRILENENSSGITKLLLTGKRGSFIAHFIFLYIIFIIDFFNECNKQKNIIKPVFGEALKQATFTILPLYLLLASIKFVIPDYSTNMNNINVHIANILEGIVVFLFYNWSINFRKINNHLKCQPITDKDISDIITDKRKEAILRGDKLPIVTMKKHPTEEVTTTETVINTDTGDDYANTIINIKTDYELDTKDTDVKVPDEQEKDEEDEEDEDSKTIDTKPDKDKLKDVDKTKKGVIMFFIIAFTSIFIITLIVFFYNIIISRKSPYFESKAREILRKDDAKLAKFYKKEMAKLDDTGELDLLLGDFEHQIQIDEEKEEEEDDEDDVLDDPGIFDNYVDKVSKFTGLDQYLKRKHKENKHYDRRTNKERRDAREKLQKAFLDVKQKLKDKKLKDKKYKASKKQSSLSSKTIKTGSKTKQSLLSTIYTDENEEEEEDEDDDDDDDDDDIATNGN